MWLPQEMYAPMHSMVGWLGLDLGRSVTALPTDVASTNGLISIVAIVTFTALYSTTGGLRSVIATDVLQFIVAMTATLVFAVPGRRRGGWARDNTRPPRRPLWSRTRYAVPSLVANC